MFYSSFVKTDSLKNDTWRHDTAQITYILYYKYNTVQPSNNTIKYPLQTQKILKGNIKFKLLTKSQFALLVRKGVLQLF